MFCTVARWMSLLRAGWGGEARVARPPARHEAERLDEMKDHLQLWVLRAAKDDVDPSPLRGLLQLASAAEELGDQANQMVWLITDDRGFHPIVKVALGEADVVATERATLENLTRNEGKPEAAIGKIVDGRVKGFFKDICLLEQPYAKDDKQSVAQVIGKSTIVRYSQVEIG